MIPHTYGPYLSLYFKNDIIILFLTMSMPVSIPNNIDIKKEINDPNKK